MHFEWVWDGKTVFLVQADECDTVVRGVDPEKLIQIPTGAIDSSKLSTFRVVTTEDFQKYRKLANAALYQDLGYEIVDFYILDDQIEIRRLLDQGECSSNLFEDLRALTLRPLVIRTDGQDIPSKNRQMLPRSDELRGPESAQKWLLESFRSDAESAGISKSNLCLIAHHFVPATAAAWCQAHPDRRRVRIESLWGIHLKHFEKADALVELGLGLAGERAKSLIADLKVIRRDNMLRSDL